MGNAATFDFELEQGATKRIHLTLKDSQGALVDLTGYTALMQIRKNENSKVVIVSLTELDGLTLGGVAGTIVITFSKTLTSSLNFNEAKYDLKIDSGSEEKRLLEGKVTLDKQISRL